MAKMRIVNTRFWDDNYITNLDPSEKLVFIYLLTNSLTNISGIYEIPSKRIALDTGFDREMVEKITRRFDNDEKILYRDGWIAIKNFVKHQALNPKIIAGIRNEAENAPESLVSWCFPDGVNTFETTDFKRKKVKASIRLQVLQRDNFKCVFCGKTKSEAIMEVDHINPVSNGGGNELENLRVLCQQCNGGRNMGSLSHPNSNSNLNSNPNTASAKPSAVKQPKYTQIGAEVLKAFESVDPKNKTYYANTTQRSACDFLVAEHGLEKVLGVVAVLPQINQMKLYLAQITTPYELKENWVKLGNKMKSKENEVNEKINRVVW